MAQRKRVNSQKTKSKVHKSTSNKSLLGRISQLSSPKKMALFLMVALLFSTAATYVYYWRKVEDIKAQAWTVKVPVKSGDAAIGFGMCFMQGKQGTVVGYVLKPTHYTNGAVYIKRYGPGKDGNPGSLIQSKAAYGVWWANQVKAIEIDGIKTDNWYQLSYSGGNGEKNVSSSSVTLLGYFIPACV